MNPYRDTQCWTCKSKTCACKQNLKPSLWHRLHHWLGIYPITVETWYEPRMIHLIKLDGTESTYGPIQVLMVEAKCPGCDACWDDYDTRMKHLGDLIRCMREVQAEERAIAGSAYRELDASIEGKK